MASLEAVVFTFNPDYMWSEVMDTQLQAQRFYGKMGFEWIFTHHLEYKKSLPKYRGIQILRKNIT